MSDFGEAVGSMVEGGLLARAVEPQAGEGKDGHTHEGACLNCGTAMVGQHCHACGQRAHVHKTLGAFMHDLLHGVFHLEGKTWHTLPMLAWKPGELTRRYIDGQRAYFVSPMALFLFSVFLMFAVFQIAGISTPDDLNTPGQVVSEETTDDLEGLRQARKAMGDDNPASPIIDTQIERLEKEAAGKDAESSATVEDAAPAPAATTNKAAADDGKEVLASTSDGLARITTDKNPTGISVIDRLIEKWRHNPELMAYKLQANSYKFSWLLIPLSIPFVWLLFLWRRRFGAYDHAVFVTYSLSFMTLLFVILTVLGQFGVSTALLVTVGTMVPIYHIYRQLKGAYGLSRFSALWRTSVLLVFIVVILALFLNVLLLLGAF
ncbi:DUF3667 domain-containing protein [Altererythrobacter salegens]|uniref:DUF3667 domain-containing protein n=1 Tax=Croceibacterium salegens TaxID=1737568 RepID=A0A6I4T1A9_9SPHN|nr:DUF3667 domain-containing protein [Croceibacterium salegens]MXO61047.1 DUF3667 domain-containing protein [Croceibacterium salegens]